MTPKQRASRAANVRWDLPRASHRGTLSIGSIDIPCFVLTDQRRVFSASSFGEAFGVKALDRPSRVVRVISNKSLVRFAPESLISSVEQPIRFRIGKQSRAGYEPSVLVGMCTTLSKASRAKKLTAIQASMAEYAELLRDAFTEVGLVALIDEATGFQTERARDGLQEYLSKLLSPSLAAWEKTFPDRFYSEIFRLRKLKGDPKERPPYFGGITNDIIYDRLAPGIRTELEERNPKIHGHRAAKHHQWLSRSLGHVGLKGHLDVVVTLMELSDNWGDFLLLIDRVRPRHGYPLGLPFPVPAEEKPAPHSPVTTRAEMRTCSVA